MRWSEEQNGIIRHCIDNPEFYKDSGKHDIKKVQDLLLLKTGVEIERDKISVKIHHIKHREPEKKYVARNFLGVENRIIEEFIQKGFPRKPKACNGMCGIDYEAIRDELWAAAGFERSVSSVKARIQRMEQEKISRLSPVKTENIKFKTPERAKGMGLVELFFEAHREMFPKMSEQEIIRDLQLTSKQLGYERREIRGQKTESQKVRKSEKQKI